MRIVDLINILLHYLKKYVMMLKGNRKVDTKLSNKEYVVKRGGKLVSTMKEFIEFTMDNKEFVEDREEVIKAMEFLEKELDSAVNKVKEDKIHNSYWGLLFMDISGIENYFATYEAKYLSLVLFTAEEREKYKKLMAEKVYDRMLEDMPDDKRFKA